MPFITLTTDLGDKDFHVPVLRAYLATGAPGIQVHDISHKIEPFNLIEAAFTLKACFHHFPDKTIHVIGVEGDFSQEPRFIAARYNDHFFLAKDSGIVSLIIENNPEEAVWLQSGGDQHKFPLRDVLSAAAIQLARGAELEQIGEPIEELDRRILPKPQTGADMIRGQIAYLTGHGNAISNIHRRDFNPFEPGRSFRIHFSRFESVSRIVNSYYDVPEGEVACFFGWHGFLEIGINGGNGASLLSLPIGKNIIIELT